MRVTANEFLFLVAVVGRVQVGHLEHNVYTLYTNIEVQDGAGVSTTMEEHGIYFDPGSAELNRGSWGSWNILNSGRR